MDSFSTSDFPLGITLISLGFTLESISRATPQRLQFGFRRQKGLDETVQAFWRDEIRVEPKLFYLNQKLLKSRINATR